MANRRLSDQVRDAVSASGLSRYAICREIRLSQAAMSRFMTGKTGLNMATLDRLAELLGLTIVTRTKGKRTK
jgi:transcriptional regulator with XRE-family HTH domain